MVLALRYTNLADIRSVTGISSTLISDADLTLIGALAEFEAERDLNTTFIPTTIIESYEGDGTSRLVLKRNPLIKVRGISTQGVSVTPAYTKILVEPGVLWLTSSAEQTIFASRSTSPYNNIIQYDFGLLDTTTTSTSLSSASVAGSSIVLAVGSSTGIVATNYCKIEGMDGNTEVFKVSAVATGTITADLLSWPHIVGSTVTLLQVPQIAIEYMNNVAGLMSIGRIVGATYSNVLSYAVGEINITKGNPMLAWKESAEQLKGRMDIIKRAFRSRPVVM